MNWIATQFIGSETIAKHSVRYVVTWSGRSGKWNATVTRNNPNDQVESLIGKATATDRAACVERARRKALEAIADCTCEWCE